MAFTSTLAAMHCQEPWGLFKYLLDLLALLEIKAHANGRITPSSITAPPRRYLLKPVAGTESLGSDSRVKKSHVLQKKGAPNSFTWSFYHSYVQAPPSIDRGRFVARHRF